MYLYALLGLYSSIINYTLTICVVILNNFVTEGARFVVTYDLKSIFMEKISQR